MEHDLSVRIVSNGAYGTCCSLLFSLESSSRIHSRILFNAGEGSQRIFAQHRWKSAQLSGVWLTRCETVSAAGLGGLHFALADAGTEKLKGMLYA